MTYDVSVTSHVRTPFPQDVLQQACINALKHSKVTSAQIEILVVGDKSMRDLNKKHLNHDYTTDVLSFDLGSTPEADMLGQLIICYSYAKKEAAKRSISVSEEICRYAIHGTLHLLGYDDTKEKERSEMWEVQEELVRQLSLS